MKHSLLSVPLLLLLACQAGSPAEKPEGAGPSGGQSATGGTPVGSTTAAPSDSSATATGSGGQATQGPSAGSDAGGSAGSSGGSAGNATTGTGGAGLPAGELWDDLAEVADLDAAGFAERTQVDFETLDYDPSEASGLELIQGSDLGMTEAELAKYQESGFVISTGRVFPHFSYGYASIYAQDLPLYISADSILYAMHTTYADILKSFEEQLLVPEVARMLERMRGALGTANLPSEVQRDLDVFLTVAYSLITGELQAPLLSDNEAQVTSIYEDCVAAGAAGTLTLFGAARELDFSQFKPRGHYTDSALLQRYFRAMIWLGRTDFRLLEADASGELQLNRRQAEAALALRSLMDDGANEAYASVDAIVTAFVGEHDTMTAPELDDLMSDLGVDGFSGLADVSDDTLKQTISTGGYGAQRISSQIMVGGVGGGATPLPASFALFGQRYVVDSHVFSNVVYDRVQLAGTQRMLPNPLDVAYAALGNDQAGMLLAPELETYDYAAALASMRTVVDSESEQVWQLNLYNRWLDALRSLSPSRAWASEAGETLPQVAKTEAWGRRLLNTQLASWAELRHDTILYTKQSYTAGGTCEYPDAYVDPYPEFFERVAAFAEHALGVMAEHGFVYDESVELSYDLLDPVFARTIAIMNAERALKKFVEVGGILAEMAEHQRTGAPHSEAHMQFVNQAVAIQTGCGSDVGASGWYADLFVDGASAIEWSPTIADVHTQPDDGAGNPVGKVLHVGTGDIRLMVTSVDTCSGPRAYVGLVSSYYERLESDWKRLDDEEWKELLRSEPPESPAWLSSLTAE